jgi:hypothetical protein
MSGGFLNRLDARTLCRGDHRYAATSSWCIPEQYVNDFRPDAELAGPFPVWDDLSRAEINPLP